MDEKKKLYWMQRHLPDGTEVGVTEVVTELPSDTEKVAENIWVYWDDVGYVEFELIPEDEEVIL